MLVRTHPLAALFLVGALLLTGCSTEEPEPKIAEAPSAAPTPVEKETAEEFIRRWNDEQTEMQKGDTAAWRAMTSRCKGCLATADQVDKYYAAGGDVSTDGRTILSIRKSDRSPSLKHAYLIEVDSSPTTYRIASGSPYETLDGGQAVYEIHLKKSGGSWKFVDYWQIPS